MPFLVVDEPRLGIRFRVVFLPHRDDDVADQHNVGHDGGEGAGVGCVSYKRALDCSGGEVGGLKKLALAGMLGETMAERGIEKDVRRFR